MCACLFPAWFENCHTLFGDNYSGHFGFTKHQFRLRIFLDPETSTENWHESKTKGPGGLQPTDVLAFRATCFFNHEIHGI